MAAPSNAFISQTYNANTTGGTVQHSLAIPTDDATTLKNRFYLDKLYQVQTSSGTTFIGGCKVGSFNYQHHNTNRVGALRSRAEDLSEVVYFTDAGLNTKGNTNNVRVPVPLVGFISGSDVMIKVLADYYSAYYVNTDNYGIEYIYKPTGVGGGTYSPVSGGTLLQQVNAIDKDLYLTGFDRANILPGYQLYIKPYITNVEGTTKGSEFSIPILAAYQVVKSNYSYEGQYAACKHPGSGDLMTVFSERGDLSIGDTLYLDYLKTTTATAASYGYEIMGFEPKFLLTNSAGVIVNYGHCPVYLLYQVATDVPDEGGAISVYMQELNHISPSTPVTVNGVVRVGTTDEFGDFVYTNHSFTIVTGSDFGDTATFDGGGGSPGTPIYVEALVGSAEITDISISPGSNNDGGDVQVYDVEIN